MDWKARNQRLADLGFESYDDYLASSRWNTLRMEACRLAEERCQLCNKSGVLHVHHRSYARLGTSQERKDLVVLCERCHEKFHGIAGSGGRRIKRLDTPQTTSTKPVKKKQKQGRSRRKKTPTSPVITPAAPRTLMALREQKDIEAARRADRMRAWEDQKREQDQRRKDFKRHGHQFEGDWRKERNLPRKDKQESAHLRPQVRNRTSL